VKAQRRVTAEDPAADTDTLTTPCPTRQAAAPNRPSVTKGTGMTATEAASMMTSAELGHTLSVGRTPIVITPRDLTSVSVDLALQGKKATTAIAKTRMSAKPATTSAVTTRYAQTSMAVTSVTAKLAISRTTTPRTVAASTAPSHIIVSR